VAAVNHLQYSFLKLLFWPSNRRPNQYAIFHPYTKFHKNRTIRCWVMAKTLFRKSQSWISKIWNLCEMTASFIGITFYAPNFIKIGRFFTAIWWFNDFQNGGRPPSWIFEIGTFCHVAFVGMPLCFILKKFAKIGQWVNELWPKNNFQYGGRPPSSVLKNCDHVTIIEFNICCSVPNFIKIGQLLSRDAMHKRDLCCHAVSVCLSDCHVRVFWGNE